MVSIHLRQTIVIAQEKAGPKDYLRLVRSWLKLKEIDQAEECLRKAEPHTNDSDLRFCAEHWLEDFNSPDDAARCAKKLEKYAKAETDDSAYYWHECAKLWEMVGNKEDASRCQQMTEDDKQ